MKHSEYKLVKDEEIITEIVQNNKNELYEVLYLRYYARVLDKCYMLLKNRQLAEEFVEDVFSKVYEKLGSFKNMSSFSSWLYSITYNHCIDYLRNKKKMHYPDWNRENEIPEIVDETEEEFSINYENLMVILELIHPEEKALLLMKYKDDLSLKVISTSMRISEDATKMRLKRARARVFHLYKQRFLKDN